MCINNEDTILEALIKMMQKFLHYKFKFKKNLINKKNAKKSCKSKSFSCSKMDKNH